MFRVYDCRDDLAQDRRWIVARLARDGVRHAPQAAIERQRIDAVLQAERDQHRRIVEDHPQFGTDLAGIVDEDLAGLAFVIEADRHVDALAAPIERAADTLAAVGEKLATHAASPLGPGLSPSTSPSRMTLPLAFASAAAGTAPLVIQSWICFDEDAEKLWKKIAGLPSERVQRFDEKDNFWEMGETGPCGPCSEIHIDLTPDKSGATLVNAGDPRVMEIWNLVFIQYNREADKSLKELPAKHVDTGMGFERVLAMLNNMRSNYDTDLFTPLIGKVSELSRKGYEFENGVAHRAIADHLRCLSFAIADGALPSNEGRGYVLRRILRRAARFGRQLGFQEPFFYKLVPV